MGENEQHSLMSSFRERLIEHLFIGQLLTISWLFDNAQLEVARPEVDSQGYDIVLENQGVIRHVQIKSSKLGARTREQNVHVALANKPSGCVIWVYFDELTLSLGPYYVFGDDAGKPLPPIEHLPVARHTKGDAQGVKHERPRIRRVKRSLFHKVEEASGVYEWLFGLQLQKEK
ncbi:hypothetical protein [Oceanithermus sp.]|uniref:hypothetical protein n=1 Tax=Oceanithermus sp. TaxID=2268145 RepID=UPI00257D41CD|nr:hypothetical protein [Oceanithermus sp.]